MSVTTEARPRYVELLPGDPAPWFRQRSTSNPRYVFDTAAGRHVVLLFFGSARDEAGQAALDAVTAARSRFDDQHAAFFGVSLDPGDEAEGRVRESLPGIRHFWDFDGTVSRLYGAVPAGDEPVGTHPARRFWVVLDAALRVKRVFALRDHEAVFAYLDTLAAPGTFGGEEVMAPVLLIPDVFEPAFCRRLIEAYDAAGGELSGFMREVDGKTVGVHDRAHKVRRDHLIEDQNLIQQTQARIRRRIVPEILKVHQFRATRMERYLVGCYSADDGGHFRAHRDNTTPGTAHRRFAVSINLNGDFEGGEVSFPEYGPRSFKPPPGGAVVFSCSLLHAVSRVTSGRRYAFLPFLYDDAAAKVREQNATSLAGSSYKS
ncbi:2OG-Fe(II) oxygenase [Roseomonas sp. CCTCC AB2023176]|uniref:2OG-Fe(II) oxygenase n=1 Tax=Roseomonas sp. CCTCC AB2023176 TaxID=3342640 RepID=UPI0035DC8922